MRDSVKKWKIVKAFISITPERSLLSIGKSALVSCAMKYPVVFFYLMFGYQAWGQNPGSEFGRVNTFIHALQDFSKNIPQEKVYLHFDNTSYYQGDHIWFKCYVVTSAYHPLSRLSRTLYVELLNPGGEVVDKRTLEIENGQCHGDFILNQLPFYSGFYEVRAYTKYMLNFGEDIIFSRLLPVFDKPETNGNHEERKMMKYGRYGAGDYPMKRERPLRGKHVNVRFFPEGGNMIRGVAARVAFEATDEDGSPIDVAGVVLDGNKQELSTFATLHEGRGVFTFTPAAGKLEAAVEYSGKKYRFDLPAVLAQGVAMETDNLSHPDSIGIILRKNADTPAGILGVAVLSGGRLQSHIFAYTVENETCFKMDKTRLPAGVSQIVLFNGDGDVLCDRLIFAGRNNLLDIGAKTGKPAYKAHELVDMEISLTDRDAHPVRATFSLSVRDGANEVEHKDNILTHLLLMSEIKGYVRNPSYYFEGKNDTVETCRAASLLDLLLMVQGWRRYSWKRMAGTEPFEIRYFPEQGIEVGGQVVTLVRQKPRPNVDVGLFLQKSKEGDGEGGSYVESFVTDSLGRFAFVSDVSGKWGMILTVKEKGKAKDHRILLDRVFSPEPGRYRYADLQVNIAEKNSGSAVDEEMPAGRPPEDDGFESFFSAYRDSLARLGIEGKVHRLPEVTVDAKRRTKEQDIFHNRSTAVAYYDVSSEMDDIYDRGKFTGNDIHQMLLNMSEDFSIRYSGNREWIQYKNRMPLFVVNYEIVTWDELGYFKYKLINLSAIKSIYINEKNSVMCQYIHSPSPLISPCAIADRLSCVIFIETHPEGQIPVDGAKGVRKTWLDGYSAASEFYSPDYSALPPEPDYRRTLYWNPSVTPDEAGHAKIKFYNNSRCTNFSISAETVTPQGVIGVYNEK
jgi:hypothetical protein